MRTTPFTYIRLFFLRAKCVTRLGPGVFVLIILQFGSGWAEQIDIDPADYPSGTVLIPGGPFQMGHPGRDSIGKQGRLAPRHDAFVTTFTVSRNLVTVGEYAEFLNSDGVSPKRCLTKSFNGDRMRLMGKSYTPVEGCEDWPMNCVTWVGANEYCQWMSNEEARFRLPTEAEWEYLASNGGKTRFPWGNEDKIPPNGAYPMYMNRIELFYLPVASLRENANVWGVYDLVGSAAQWCSDYYSETSYRQPNYPRVDPLGPSFENAEKTEKKRLGPKTAIPYRVERGGRICPVYGRNYFHALFSEGFVPRAYTRKRRAEGHRGSWRTEGDLGFRWVVERTSDK